MSVPERARATVARIVESMTMAEKVAQLTCAVRVPEATWLVDAEGTVDVDALLERHPDGVGQLGRPSQRLSPAHARRITSAIQRAVTTRTRPGIPLLFNEEGLHGHMAIGGTSFPSAIALAATWDPDLIEEVYTAVAAEVRARGSNYVYAPVLDLARDARWGRFEETFGEDPHLTSRLGVAAIRGLQGTDWSIPPDRVLACAKHVAGHGAPEAGVNAAPLSAGERELREEHLVPFEAAVREADVGAVMVAYHEIDGIPCHASPWLLTDVLRTEWGFTGMASSDGFGVPQLAWVHRVAADEADAARIAIEAGVDAEVPEPRCFPNLRDLVDRGIVATDTVDRAVTHVLMAKARLGLLDGAVDEPAVPVAVVNGDDHRRRALEAARRSAVLLTNDGTLPVDPTAIGSAAVVGPMAAHVHLGGYAEDPLTGTSLLAGLLTALPDADVTHAVGCHITEGDQGPAAWWADTVQLADPDQQGAHIAEAVAAAERSELVVLAIGGNEGTAREAWWYDHLGDRDSLALPGRQDDLVEAVTATGTPTVAVVFGGRPLEIGDVIDRCAAVLQVWYPGQEGGTAIAEILTGAVVPSGKLPATMPRTIGQIPIHHRRRPSAGRGYLFSSTEPLFPFGHGLSYTTFDYGPPAVDDPVIRSDGRTTLRCSVTNTGAVAGTETVQVYVHDVVASVTRPVRSLRHFRRIRLEPGERREIAFTIGSDDLALVDRSMRRIVEPGVFEVFVGGSSDATASTTLTVV